MLRRRRNPTIKCRPTIEKRRPPFHAEITGVAACQLAARLTGEGGGTDKQLSDCSNRTGEAIVAGLSCGALTGQDAADEAVTNADILAEREKPFYHPPAWVIRRLAQRLDEEQRPEWEVKETDQRLDELVQLLDSRLKNPRSDRERRQTEWDLAMVLGVKAVVTEHDPEEALECICRALNLTWEHHRAAWYLFLQLLIRILDQLGQFQLVEALRNFLKRSRRSIGAGRDPYLLNRRLWKL